MASVLSGQALGLQVDPGEDSVSPSGMLDGQEVYCGYISGTFTNYNSVKLRFPGKKYIAITPHVGAGDCLDIETGDATPADAPTFSRQWRPVNLNKPTFYANASTMPAVISALTNAGFARTSYYLFVAEWNGDSVIPPGYDAHQYRNTAGYDADSFYDYMWLSVKPPVPVPIPAGLPINVHGSCFATMCQINLAWSAPLKAGTESTYEIQVEQLSPKGWSLVSQFNVAGTTASIKSLASKRSYRVRVSKGTWSAWYTFNTP